LSSAQEGFRYFGSSGFASLKVEEKRRFGGHDLWNVEAFRRLATHLVSCEQKLMVVWHPELELFAVLAL
jgi:hypothetical protein